jgi:hypothetical protein
VSLLDPCPVDVEAWQKANRLHLPPDHKFTWTLVRTDRDSPSISDLQMTTRAVMSKWLGSDAEVLSVKRLDGPYVVGPGLRREQIPGPPPTIDAKLPIYIIVEWANRSTSPMDVPWPTRKAGMAQLATTAACPVKADWMLQETVDEGQADPPKPILEKMGEAIAKGASDVAAGAAKGIGWGLVAAVAIAAGLIWLTSSKKAE